MAELKEKTLEAYEQFQCRQMLAAISDYEQGRLDVDRFMSRLWLGVYGLEEYSRGELKEAIRD